LAEYLGRWDGEAHRALVFALLVNLHPRPLEGPPVATAEWPRLVLTDGPWTWSGCGNDRPASVPESAEHALHHGVGILEG
jgi:hypothetical protein